MVYTPLIAVRRQCQRTPISIAPNFHAKRRSPQTAGDLIISTYTILNNFLLHARRIWLFAAFPDVLTPLSVLKSSLTKIESKTGTCFPTSNMLQTSRTQSLNHRHLCCGRKYTSAPVIRWSITLLSHFKATLRVALRRTYKTITTTHLGRVQSRNISSLGSRSGPWSCTMTPCWRQKTLLSVPQASKSGIVSRSSWLACQMIRISGSGNYTLSRIWDGITITNALSNPGVEMSSKAWDGWRGSQPTLSISFPPLSVALTVIRPHITCEPKCTLRTGGGRPS